MKSEPIINQQASESYYISHPEHSFAIFAISENGDLFINGDWGQSNFAWRSYGVEKSLTAFKAFLCDLDEGYWKGKMQYNLGYMDVKKIVVKNFVEHTWPLFQILQQHIKTI
jgi:hypothetical protein